MPMEIHGELSVYESADARFEIAAQKLGLEQGVYRYLKFPEREITVYIPVALDNGQLEVFTGYRILALHRTRPGQRRHPVCAGRLARRSARSGCMDDLEMRGRQHSFRRRKGRCDLRSREPF